MQVPVGSRDGHLDCCRWLRPSLTLPSYLTPLTEYFFRGTQDVPAINGNFLNHYLVHNVP